MGEPLEGDKEEMPGATCIREDSQLCLSNFKFLFIVVNNTKHIHVFAKILNYVCQTLNFCSLLS